MVHNERDVVVDLRGLRPGGVRGQGRWVTGRSRGEPFAVSGRCRHQLADLSQGHVDADGCLVCPWHASRYDVRTGEMVDGPRGFLGYRGPTPGYSRLVRAYAKHLRLQVGRVADVVRPNRARRRPRATVPRT